MANKILRTPSAGSESKFASVTEFVMTDFGSVDLDVSRTDTADQAQRIDYLQACFANLVEELAQSGALDANAIARIMSMDSLVGHVSLVDEG